jgi:hypothetical protein
MFQEGVYRIMQVFPTKTHTMPAVTGTQNRNFADISLLNVPLQKLLVGVETPIPPKMTATATPDGAPRGGSKRLK